MSQRQNGISNPGGNSLGNPIGSQSAAYRWPPLRRFIAAETRFARRMAQRTSTLILYEFVRFGIKQAWACLFAGLMLGLIIATHFAYPKGAMLARYDFLFLAAVTIQIAMLTFKLEIRIQTAVVSYQFRNLLQERYQQIPGFNMPRQTQFYGVRWDFWN